MKHPAKPLRSAKPPYYISIGSNVQPQKNISRCVRILSRHFTVLKISSVYETPPAGPAGTEKFWNLALSIRSEASAAEIQAKLHEIEHDLGRRRDPLDKFAPRTIDLDLLPQNGYNLQAHIMIPLAEIAPNAQDVSLGKTFAELAEPLQKKAESFKRMAAPAGKKIR